MAITLQDIENFSMEVRTLVQAGLPLERHLADAGRGHGKSLQQLTQTISDDLNRGVSLEDAVRNVPSGVPRLLTAAIAAGVQTSQLETSIEMLGDMAHDLNNLRRRVLQALTYPLIVIAVALLLFCLFIRGFLARVRDLFDDPEAVPSVWLIRLTDLDAEFWWWPLMFPVIGLGCLFAWSASGRAVMLSFRGPERALLIIPGVAALVRDLHCYHLTRILSLLVERQIPLPNALQLAGACSGSPGLDAACQTAAERLNSGNMLASHSHPDWQPGTLPPMLMTCLKQTGHNESQLKNRLNGVSGFYQRRLDLSLAWMKNVIPVALFVVVGGGTVALYSLVVFWPVLEVYRNINPF